MKFNGFIWIRKKTETPDKEAAQILEFITKLNIPFLIKIENQDNFLDLIKKVEKNNLFSFNEKFETAEKDKIRIRFHQSKILGNSLEITLYFNQISQDKFESIILPFYENLAKNFPNFTINLEASGRGETKAIYWHGRFEKDKNLEKTFEHLEAYKKEVINKKSFVLFKHEIKFNLDQNIVERKESKKKLVLKELGTGKQYSLAVLIVKEKLKDKSETVLLYLGYPHFSTPECLWIKGRTFQDAQKNANQELRKRGLTLVEIK
ncbi:MAG: hypothetical protein KAT77_03355 [Nanoarchaeota archaeon]|nr:hypothetical protein [Nanoarchaeota archaeon]